ncbi:alpha/beta hydrolase [Devosia sp. YIM 151766]|uniref:alpha/beta fold hydrolase n=1 Tax=Devosia sp. YIM 151766 TaxID=3017325 RepID=UPI00255D0399|nr:alpha/beta hydrolase [Devosia sp. YIM 151766]WIY53972.1 alpha/beta hydrolase [Devosia sp. YIM 151766]
MFALFQRRRTIPAEHPAFANLPVRPILLRDARTRAAVHMRGAFAPDRLPVVCVAGYHRNMSDFTDFADYFRLLGPRNWPTVLVDLPGRGRADNRQRLSDYGSLADARDLADILAALGIGKAIMLGQGHGGQVAMALAAAHPLLIGGTILLDAGPVTDSRGIVRLRNNLAHVTSLRGKAAEAGFRRMLSGDHPGLPDHQLDALALRTHYFGRSGRSRPLFDSRLIDLLKDFSFDDVLAAQWPLYDALKCAPLMLLRTQLTDQLRRETFEEMVRRRADATMLAIVGQGSPALLSQHEEIEAVAEFVFRTSAGRARKAA